MQIGQTAATAQPGGASANASPQVASLRIFVFALFFTFGGITSLNDVIIPKLKDLFTLSYAQAMLVQSAFFAAYFIVSLPAAAIVQRIGYMRTAVVGLLTMTAGCLLFIPASSSGMFITFLLALFVLAAGITIVQVVANPLISMLGAPATASSRLTFAQAFNSLGTTVFPYVGAILILGSLARVDQSTLSADALSAYRAAESQVVVHTYLGLAVALAIVAFLVWTNRKKLVEHPHPESTMLGAFDLLKQPRFAFGTLCIFLYVGAEVAVGSVIVNYLMQHDVLGLGAEAAGKHVPLYWGGAMVGRFLGAYVLRICSPGKVLAGAGAIAALLLLVSATTHGTTSGWALLAIGLVNSIMFPTIFTLASEGLGERAAEGSGLICVAIVGGAIVPLITGYAADAAGLRLALAVPALCYLVILAFGWYARRPLLRG
ncbi:sugar MFS transporter [Massilia sp. TW-1]|uniref:Sugar MFS transporter n=1 Tax=Telluria antibiotica TaxID=2717319 RepID=A0ABX0P7Y4_9BURK|nr:sugar MFS transporter [Telluria antibiotica]NIA53341.1 sugar MFS transporter [Telluria antibiotica]